jgi:hypothetical protein
VRTDDDSHDNLCIEQSEDGHLTLPKGLMSTFEREKMLSLTAHGRD